MLQKVSMSGITFENNKYSLLILMVLFSTFYLTGTVVTQTQARYPDGSQTGISYSIFSGNVLQSFGINTITGKDRND